MHARTRALRNTMSTFKTSREIQATPDEVFAAFNDRERLARWWGPVGFTNTFNLCEFKPGGRWSYVMHGPEAGHYQNESVFEEIEAGRKVVIRHESNPKYRLVITLTPTSGGTTISWEQTFDSEEIAGRVEKVVIPANEQNLDRLTAEVCRPRSSA
jgi:uncharacterized protein YndB with AHSA1/START domain